MARVIASDIVGGVPDAAAAPAAPHRRRGEDELMARMIASDIVGGLPDAAAAPAAHTGDEGRSS
jgi:hypothetical protein